MLWQKQAPVLHPVPEINRSEAPDTLTVNLKESLWPHVAFGRALQRMCTLSTDCSRLLVGCFYYLRGNQTFLASVETMSHRVGWDLRRRLKSGTRLGERLCSGSVRRLPQAQRGVQLEQGVTWSHLVKQGPPRPVPALLNCWSVLIKP